MPSAVFLNPIGARNARRPKKRKIKSPRLKKWLAVVKRHGGDMAAAAKEWKSGSRPRKKTKRKKARKKARPKARKVARRPKARKVARRKPKARKVARRRPKARKAAKRVRRVRRAKRGFSPTAWAKAFRGATGRRPKVRKARPGTRTWWAKVAAGARRPASKKKWASGLLALARKEARGAAVKNPRRKRRTKRRKTAKKRSRALARRNPARNITPTQWRRRWQRATGLRMRRNPVTKSLKVLTSKGALEDYAYVTGGFVAGAVLPPLVAEGLRKLGVSVPSGLAAEALLGIGTSLAAGAATSAITKDSKKGIKVTAGGLAGVVGALIVGKLREVLPVSGLGNAESAVRLAVERELRKAGLGQFTVPEQVAEAPEVTGFGQFVTTEEVEEASEVSGLDQDIEEGAQAFDGFDGDVFA